MTQPTEASERSARAPLRRSVALGLAIGVPVAIAAAAVTYAIVAIPMYTLAQADPHGLDRPFFRHALVRIALPVGAVIGLMIGSVVGVWYRRGGHLPTDRTPF
ncbi:MAG TPA: hypothetical protein VGZ52_06865 [Acidimicrobiales bacterium]|jgi:hypothetical protein|nr:hypothetical protein [Acidimicrobiales bacterium]